MTVPSSTLANPGSQAALRSLNQQRILDTLLASGPSTQAELARQTGLSSATISNLVKLMEGFGTVETSPTTSSGRRALLVRLVDDGAIAVGIDFGRRHLRVVLATPGYRVIAEEFLELDAGQVAAEGIDLAHNLLRRLLDEHHITDADVLGVGVGIPGPIDRGRSAVVGSILPEWSDIDFASIGERLGFPVILENDANLGALAEVAWGPHGATKNLAFVKIGTGIGAGLILNGALFYGNLGITGEIGHGTMIDYGTVCHCGNRGCLETVASTSVMIEVLSRVGQRRVTTSEIILNALGGDSATLRVVDDAGTAVGRALANLANLVNPEVIVIGGSLSRLGDLLLVPMRRGFRRHTVPIVGESTTIVMSSVGDRAEALGAVALVLQRAPARGAR